MANDPLKDIEKFVNDIQKTICLSVSRKNLTRYGNLAIKRIQARTLKGSGVQQTGQLFGRAKKLKPLSASYKKQRRRNSSKLSSHATPNKSNLTFTGQMLESLKLTKINTRNGSFKIEPKGKRNKDVAGFVDEGGRSFLGLTTGDVTAIRKEYQSTFSKLVRRRLT